MFDFIERHKNIFLIGGTIIVLSMIVALVFMSSKQAPPVTTENVNNELGYTFLEDSNVSDQDKYLQLLGMIMTEEYGTYSANDTLQLVSVQNQATDQFKDVVQRKIDSITTNTSLVTNVNPESIELSYLSPSSVVVRMQAETVGEKGQKQVVESFVYLLKQGEFWLVNSIDTQQGS